MASKFQQDEFGLFHAAVLHPHDPRAIQIMVFKSDGGWWAYVDGDRLEGTFRSKWRAAKAARRTARTLPASSVSPANGRPGSAVHRVRCGRMTGTAAYVLSVMLACSSVLFVFGALDSASNLSASATTHKHGEFTMGLPVGGAVPPVPEMKTRTAEPVKPVSKRVRTASRHVSPGRKAKVAKRWTKRKHKNTTVWAKDIPMPSQD
ncbi:MAG: hypothetical protein ACR2O4_05905 [Hyphomicrobiaceae bacterium]